MEKLNEKALGKALKDNKSYDGVEPFLEQIRNGNIELADIVSSVIVQAFNSQKVTLMTKLLALRLFKDIFMLGNMQFVDSLSPEVEENIISAAAFNPKFRSKGKNEKETRGGNYFVETEGRPKDKMTLQLGNSFVLLATEIIYYFGRWYPGDGSNEESRFLEAYQELESLGVPFNTKIYFTAEEEAQFHKNHEQWKVKRKQSKTNQQKNGEQKKQEIAQEDSEAKIEGDGKKRIISQEVMEKMRLESQGRILKMKKDNEAKVIELKQIHESQIQQKSQLLDQKQLLIEEKDKENQQLKISLQKNQEKVKQLQRLLEEFKIREESKKEHNAKANESEEIFKLKKQLQQRNIFFQNALQKKQGQIKSINEKYQRIESQKEDMRSKIKEKENIIQGREQKIKELESRMIKNDTLSNLSKLSPEREESLVERLEALEAENKALKIEREGSKQESKLLSLKYEESLAELDEMNRKLLERREKEEKVQQLVAEASDRIVEKQRGDEIEVNKQNNQFSATLNHSHSKFLSTHQLNNTFAHGHQTRPNSISKTEKCREKVLRERQTGMSSHKTEMSYLKKTIQKGFQKKQPHSVFPFISEYFPHIDMKESQHFRACCVSSHERSKPFFYDEKIEIYLHETEHHQLYLKIKNTTAQTAKIMVQSESSCIQIGDISGIMKVLPFSQEYVKITSEVTSLNFRFPVFTIIMINDGVSTEYKVPIPLALSSFASYDQTYNSLMKWEQKGSHKDLKRFRCEKFLLNHLSKELCKIFDKINFQSHSLGLEGTAVMRYPAIPEIKTRLRIIECQGYCQIEVEFDPASRINEAFSKVILQVLMFSLI